LPDKNIVRSDYNEAINLLVQEASQNDTISAVYLMGGEVEPGFSDLDFVVVYKDNVKPAPLPFPPLLSEKSKFIFTHRYLSFFESDSKYFYYIYPKDTANLRLIWDKDIAFDISENILAAEDYKMLLAFILFDLLINKLLPFKRYEAVDKLDVRNVIAELHSLIYTFILVEKLTGKKIGDEFSLEIKNLRKNWFENSNEENSAKLGGLLKDGINLVSDVVTLFDGFMRSKNLEADSSLSFKTRRLTINFTNSWDENVFSEASNSGTLILPESFSYFLLAYASSEGPFSAKISSCLNKAKRIIFNSEGTGVHVSIMNGLFKNYQNYGFKMPFSYGISKNYFNLFEIIKCIFIK